MTEIYNIFESLNTFYQKFFHFLAAGITVCTELLMAVVICINSSNSVNVLWPS